MDCDFHREMIMTAVVHLGFFARLLAGIKSYTLRHERHYRPAEGEDYRMLVWFLFFCALTYAACHDVVMPVRSLDDWLRAPTWALAFGSVLAVIVLVFLVRINKDFWPTAWARIGLCMSLYRAPGDVREESRQFGLFAVLLTIAAIVLWGRINAYDTGLWIIDTGLHTLISTMLVFPPVVAVFVWATAQWVRRPSRRNRWE